MPLLGRAGPVVGPRLSRATYCSTAGRPPDVTQRCSTKDDWRRTGDASGVSEPGTGVLSCRSCPLATSALTPPAVVTCAEAPVVTNDDTQTAPELLTLAETAAVLRTPVATLRYWRHLGVGPDGFRVGRRVVYRREDVNRWLSEQQQAQSAHR